MRNTNKKGFTIVELVIVIAVVAVLAAVLIPTFAGLIDAANQSADQQAVTNMNKILATEEKADGLPGVVDILVKNNFAEALTTYYKGYSLAWVESENAIVLLDKDSKIVFPKQYADKELAFQPINPVANDADSMFDSLVPGGVVVLGSDITASELFAHQAGTQTVNLNGNKVTTNDYNVSAAYDDVVLEISNGSLEYTGSRYNSVVLADWGGTIKLSNVQVFANNQVAVHSDGGTLILDNVTAVQSGENENDWANAAIHVTNRITKESSDIVSYAKVIVNSGVYNGKYALQMSAPGGTVEINGGTFYGASAALNLEYNKNAYPTDADHTPSVTINGGNFTGAINVYDGVELVINGGTFSNTGLTFEQFNEYVSADSEAVDNGNGTYTVTAK